MSNPPGNPPSAVHSKAVPGSGRIDARPPKTRPKTWIGGGSLQDHDDDQGAREAAKVFMSDEPDNKAEYSEHGVIRHIDVVHPDAGPGVRKGLLEHERNRAAV